jgi:phosphoribosylamine--glycine ligase
VIYSKRGILRSTKRGILSLALTLIGRRTGFTIYHAGTVKDNETFLTNGGRVLGVTATGESSPRRFQISYAAAEKISFTAALSQ